MIGIIDYGMGNLRSVENALKRIGKESVISGDPAVLSACDKLILPGVGAFGDCMRNVQSSGLEEFIREYVAADRPLLGICVGMQMMFESSEEKGITPGFGFMKGKIVRFVTDLPVPQIGWNLLEWNKDTPLQSELSGNPFVYYVHSYYASGIDDADLVGYSMYGDTRVPGLLVHGHVMATQFHPEKSAQDGLRILKYFTEEFV